MTAMIPHRFAATAVAAAALIVTVCVLCAVALGGNPPNAVASAVETSHPAPQAAATGSRSGPPRIPADGSAYIGLDGDPDIIDDFAAEAGIDKPAIRGGYIPVGGDFASFLDNFDPRQGTAPMVSWKIDFTGGRVASGRMDGYLRKQADEVRAYGGPLFLRPDWEMNGNWMQLWSLPAVTPAQYVASWRHVVDIFRHEGVHNVAFVWSPNAARYWQYAVSAWYPGDEYVSWFGVDGYPRVSSGSSILTEPDGLNAVAQLAHKHGKPLMLAEWAATLPDPDDGWAFDLVFNWAKAYPETVKALVYFDYGASDNDHLLADHPAGAAEFRYLIDHGHPKAVLSVEPAQ
jgi:hypothetical protein